LTKIFKKENHIAKIRGEFVVKNPNQKEKEKGLKIFCLRVRKKGGGGKPMGRRATVRVILKEKEKGCASQNRGEPGTNTRSRSLFLYLKNEGGVLMVEKRK